MKRFALSSIAGRQRRALLMASCAFVAGGAAAGVAHAASTVYVDRVLAVDEEAWSGLVALTSSEGLSNDGRLVCVAALDTNWAQVGQVSCTTSASGIGKPYNGTTRRAWLRPGVGAGADAKGRAVW